MSSGWITVSASTSAIWAASLTASRSASRRAASDPPMVTAASTTRMPATSWTTTRRVLSGGPASASCSGRPTSTQAGGAAWVGTSADHGGSPPISGGEPPRTWSGWVGSDGSVVGPVATRPPTVVAAVAATRRCPSRSRSCRPHRSCSTDRSRSGRRPGHHRGRRRARRGAVLRRPRPRRPRRARRVGDPGRRRGRRPWVGGGLGVAEGESSAWSRPRPRSSVGVAVGVAGVVFADAGTRTGTSWEKDALPHRPSTAGTRAATIATA